MQSVRRSERPHTVSRGYSLLAAAVLFGALMALSTPATAATFDPAYVCADGTFRAYDNMSQADIQAFLVSKKSVLASLVTSDYAGTAKKPASQIISEACNKWHIAPTVILTMLQKEQSLITRSKSGLVTGSHATIDWALGMGCPDGYSSCIRSGCHGSKPSDNRYPEYRGFGKQIWAACQSLDAYGEKGKSRPGWHHTKTPPVESANWKVGTVFKGLYTPTGTKDVALKNLTTFKLYTYNPSIGAKAPYGDLTGRDLSGNSHFWRIYMDWFGDPTADSGHVVYRMFNAKTGNYFYTTSVLERYKMLKSFSSQGIAFSWNASSTANTDAVYRAYNRTKHTYFFTPSATKYKSLTTGKSGKTWRGDGRAFRTSHVKTSASPVYGFVHKKSGLYFYTSSEKEKAKYSTSASRKKWTYRGIMFWMSK
jgi:hypothetical protein